MNLLSCLYQSSVDEGIDRSPWRPLVVPELLVRERTSPICPYEILLCAVAMPLMY